jgi:hypothetical protein
MAACVIDGVKTQTFGPNIAMLASGQRLAGDGAALAFAAPTAVAVSAEAPKSAELTARRAIFRIRHLAVLEFPEGMYDAQRAKVKSKHWSRPK